MSTLRLAGLTLLALAGCPSGTSSDPGPESLRYLRQTPRGSRPECSFTIDPEPAGWRITSVTGALTVVARYDSTDRLLEASARIDGAEPVRVRVDGAHVGVLRPGQDAQVFESAPGIIVTSAPDWSDAFRICRLWKRAQAGRQEFPGLWIHPEKPAQRLTFSAERTGSGTAGLERLSIRLRGNSAYVAWVDPAGRMIKLVSLPYGGDSAVLVLEGFEEAAAGLRPE